MDPNQLHDRQILLTSEQQHYLQRVLRLGRGDRFIAMNGQGQSWLAQIEVLDASGGQAVILEAVVSQTELPVAMTLVAALPKGNGFDEVVRQVTELGVAQIDPVISDRTLLKPSPQKLERWRRIADEAAEQSERQIVPLISEPKSFTAHLQHVSTSDAQKYICVTRQDAKHLINCLLAPTSYPLSPTPDPLSPTSLLIAIGPEGGWTEAEVEQAIAAGYHPVSLGSRILRAVTAPIVALSLIASILER